MPKEVLCPICGAAYNLADDQVGKKVRCKKCEHAFTAGGEPKRRDEDDEDEDDKPRRKAKAKKGKDRDDEHDRPKKTKSIEEQAKPRGQREPGMPVSSFVIMGVVVGILVLCCGGGTIAWLAWPSTPPRPNPNPNPPRKRGEVPKPRPLVAWLHDAEASRRRAGAAAHFADLMSQKTRKPMRCSPWA
jgi:predicted Zn finger-like uncharacterized protein